MKYRVLLLFLMGNVFSYSQELINFYAEPVSGNTINVHTVVFRTSFSTFELLVINSIDNIITLSLCYQNTSAALATYDQQQQLVTLPSGYSNYTIVIDIYGDNNGLPCTLTNLVDSGTLNIALPYKPIAKTNIPDFTFEDYLESINQGDDIPNNDLVFTHRIENMSLLFLNGQLGGLNGQVADMTGIEDFVSLNHFRGSSDLLTNIDLSNNPFLEYLIFSGNQLSQLDITNCTDLRKLLLFHTISLTELDITNNTLLEELQCFPCDNIQEVDLTNNINLNSLEISANIPLTLDITQNVELENFYFSGDNFSTIDLSQNIILKTIDFFETQLSEINLDNNPLLESINLIDGGIEFLDVSNQLFLKEFAIRGNNISSLDLSLNTQLESVAVVLTDLNSLDLRNGNNEIITSLLSVVNFNLTCIDVDDKNEVPYPDWQVDNWTVFSEDCVSIGINEEKIVEGISIYPNPTTGILRIQSKKSIEKIEVYDTLGRLITFESNNNVIDISKVNRGVYFINIIDENRYVSNKRIIKK